MKTEIRYATVGEAVDEAAERWGEEVGWIFEDRRISFREMRDASDEIARALLAQGIGKGDCVAVLMPNLAEFLFILFGCAKIGAVLTALNTRSRLFEIEHVLRHSGAALLIAVEHFLKQDYMLMLEELCGAGAIGAEGAVNSAAFPRLRRLVRTTDEGERSLMSWSALRAQAQSVPPEQLAAARESLHWREPVLLQYTSGTTARPKGALLSHVYLLNHSVELLDRLGVRRGEAYLNTQPLYHIGGAGIVLTPLSVGCPIVIPEYYEAERVLALIERERCVARSGFAAMYIMEMTHPRFREFDLSSLRAGWCVAAPEIMARVRDEMGIRHLIQLYGSTEAGNVFGSYADPWEKRSRSCGRVAAHMELQIRDMATGEPVPPGRIGEVLFRGWCTFIGYLNQPEETAKIVEPDGWVHTGDLGMLDDDGYLYFKGRLKNMLRVGGENVSAEEVEAMLVSHPKIKMAAAIGAPDARLGEVVMAIVELREGEAASEQEIIDYCAARMANFRVPRIVRFTRDWPLTGSGKIQTHALRDIFLGEAQHPA